MERVILIRRVFAILGVALLMAACSQPEPPPPAIPYDASPDAVIVQIRIDSPAQPPEIRRNFLPTCTLHGDGRVIWANPLAGGGEQLLEGVITPEKMQEYFRFITNTGFFRWANEVSANLLPPEGVDTFTSITVYLAGQTHAVSAYDSGALHGFDDIISRCLQLVTEPTLIEPDAGWVTAIPTEPRPERPVVCWPQDAPMRLAEVAAAGQTWLEGPHAAFAWSVIHETEGLPVFQEGGACSAYSDPAQLYAVIVEAPGISPFAPPRPPQ